jgi:transposase
VRGRISLLEDWTNFANKIHSLLLDNGITRRVKPLSMKGRAFLKELSLPAPWDELLSSAMSSASASVLLTALFFRFENYLP